MHNSQVRHRGEYISAHTDMSTAIVGAVSNIDNNSGSSDARVGNARVKHEPGRRLSQTPLSRVTLSPADTVTLPHWQHELE